jgi:uncharacterized protein
MSYYVLEYFYGDDYLERRGPFREEHLRLLREAGERGEIVLAGALAEPADRGLIIWNVDDTAVVEALVKQDPYVRNGLVQSWSIRPWTVVVS